jgi:hypothetical protein
MRSLMFSALAADAPNSPSKATSSAGLNFFIIKVSWLLKTVSI